MAILPIWSTFFLYGIDVVLSAVPEPSDYMLDFPTHDNPMNVSVSSDWEKNYIILLGDWGEPEDAHGNPGKVQTAIAQKMISFYNEQKKNGYNLLFVGLVGDNFYNDGQNCSYYSDRWQNMYGEISTYPWLSVFGNHDWGLNDDMAVCGWGAPNPYIDSKTQIPYAANQINKDKGGCNPENYYLPDFGYYYTINELNFEWIAVEETASSNSCPYPMGKQDWKYCNNSKTIGCEWLTKIQKTSEAMLKQRANVSTAQNFLISNHYPAIGEGLLKDFLKIRGNHSDETVWSAYGHIHKQECEGKDKNGICNLIMSGGGGGCCSEDTLRGFYVIGFDKNKKMIQPYQFNNPLISCQYPCGAQFTEDEIIERNFNYCCYEQQGRNCHLYDLSKC